MTDTTNICARCGGPGANAYNSLTGASGEWTHHFKDDCIAHLRARAEAGNTRIAELEAALDDAQLDADESREERDAAEVRLARQWKPVTEPPTEEPDNGEQGVLCLLRSYTKLHGYEYELATWHSYIINVWTDTKEELPGGYWLTDEAGDEVDIDKWQEWQLLPRQPDTLPLPPAAAEYVR